MAAPLYSTWGEALTTPAGEACFAPNLVCGRAPATAAALANAQLPGGFAAATAQGTAWLPSPPVAPLRVPTAVLQEAGREVAAGVEEAAAG